MTLLCATNTELVYVFFIDWIQHTKDKETIKSKWQTDIRSVHLENIDTMNVLEASTLETLSMVSHLLLFQSYSKRMRNFWKNFLE